VRRQTGAKELLDGPLDSLQLAGNLDDLARFNRHGGFLWASLRHWQPREGPVRLLDVGTGGADIPRTLLRRAAEDGLRLEVTATDIRPEIVSEARRRSEGVANLDIQLVAAGRLDLADSSFDVVHSSLLFHHFEPTEAVAMLREMGRVARAGVIVNDLDRRRLWWLSAMVLGRVATRNEYTRNDAPLSVARAYRPDELSALAAEAGLREVKRRWARPPYRYGLAFVRS
jgi:ubiquinone/menaquinone biosynthesis C-methylase UbiE